MWNSFDQSDQSEHLNVEEINLNYFEQVPSVDFDHTGTKSHMYVKYKNKNTKILNKKRRDDLNYLYNRNQKFSGHLVTYVRDKLAWRVEQILEKRLKTILLLINGI